MRNTENLTGRTFGELTVVSKAGSRGRKAHWWCTCACGRLSISVASSSLRSGNTSSCGCARGIHRHALKAQHTATYNSWAAMKSRCLNPANPRYKDWGGRGITVCERWLSFGNFLTDMGEKPAGTSLDRIENAGNYEKSNCRWATPAQQAANTRNTKITPAAIEEIRKLHYGQGLTMTAIGVLLGMNRHTVSRALV